MGDVDLFGFEMNEILRDKKERLLKWLKEIDNVLEEFRLYEGNLKYFNEISILNLKRVLIMELFFILNDIF